ncbi:hypothetical protein [Plantactinospora sp. WMMB782]|uniref:hypothetical protein n=1 Tax=Plantactinospora sp. WMMB782 TaxID=3404121 RepID=UPI003B93733D
MAETVRGIRVHLPTKREAADEERPIRLAIAGVAFADLTPEEADRIAYLLNYYAQQVRRG